MKPRKPTKGKSECDLCPLVVFGSHSAEVSLSVRFCISKQIRKQCCTLCIMILFLFFITILGEWGGMFIVNQFTYFCMR